MWSLVILVVSVFGHEPLAITHVDRFKTESQCQLSSTRLRDELKSDRYMVKTSCIMVTTTKEAQKVTE